MMTTVPATDNKTAGTGIVEIYGPVTVVLYTVAAADDVTSGVPLPR